MGDCSGYTPSMFLDERQIALLRNAELYVSEFYCLHDCVHHVKFARCAECPKFSPASDGHIACDGYATGDDWWQPGGDDEMGAIAGAREEIPGDEPLKGLFSLGM